jgi:pheromone shutdown protein TraB
MPSPAPSFADLRLRSLLLYHVLSLVAVPAATPVLVTLITPLSPVLAITVILAGGVFTGSVAYSLLRIANAMITALEDLEESR